MYKDLKIKMGMVVAPMLKDQNHQKGGEAITKSVRAARRLRKRFLYQSFYIQSMGRVQDLKVTRVREWEFLRLREKLG